MQEVDWVDQYFGAFVGPMEAPGYTNNYQKIYK
jgi:hypothetical protein